MRQVFAKKGSVVVDNVPAPLVGDNSVLVQVVYSCISAGTEVSSVVSSGQSLIQKAINKPEKIAKVLDNFKRKGVKATILKIQGKPESGSPLGYSASGVVLDVGKNITDIKVGDGVACAGAGIASHAEYIDVPRNLLAKIPSGVGFNEASTVTLGAIAIQGIRRADVKLGEYVAVIGLGILGQITVQLIKASGCRVIGIDLDERRIKKALEFGMDRGVNPSNDSVVKDVTAFSSGFGVDSVIITAATSSKEPLAQAFQMCRKKGRVVLVGVVGMEINREDMYKKELDFLISTSYGPGRYDEEYEQKGISYPYAYVRWTETRNMEEYLRLIAERKVLIRHLIEGEYKIEDAPAAYEKLKAQENKPLIVLLKYDEKKESNISRKIEISFTPNKTNERINIAVIGAGGFATGVHLPNIRKLYPKYKLYAVMSQTGHKAKAVAQQYSANYATTNYEDILNDKNVDLVLICTRHNSHADLTLKALKAGKNVFVEKPLATNQEDIDKIKEFYDDESIQNKPFLMVGFNRRFSKYALEIKRHTDKRINPLFIHYRMNAGYIPFEHWIHENGGRIIGEACHIIDLMTFFTNSQIESISHESLTPRNERFSATDNKSIVLKYRDGSVCTIEYFAVGCKEFPKEYMEVHFDEKTIVLDDYKSLKGYGIKLNTIMTTTSQKGHLEELERLYLTLKGDKKEWPIELWDIIQTSELTFQIS